MKSAPFSVLSLLLCATLSHAQVGIGTTTPKAFFNVPAGRTVLFGADTIGSQTASTNNVFAPKVIWYSSVGAFRAGGVSTGNNWSSYYSVWDKANIGPYSFASGADTKATSLFTTAMGYQTNASGENATALGLGSRASSFVSTALGLQTNASGSVSTAIGDNTTASGQASTAMGSRSVASRAYSVAIGYQALASNDYAITMGTSTTASGSYAIALGQITRASGENATAMGYQTTASGSYATAMGREASASGNYATAMGRETSASVDYATAMGFHTIANGLAATAIGRETTAGGSYALATGFNTVAIGENTTAMGSLVSTDFKQGSFIIGDNNETLYLGIKNANIYRNSVSNQMMMRFSGGYVLYTSSPGSQSTALGVELAANSNAWSTLSDSTRKENYRSVDGAGFLHKISTMRLGSWNYKGQDEKQYRHYGPMAQDFFAAFGHDELGTIGEDKSINQADFDGVNLIAIQALIKKVEKLEAENAVLKQQAEETAALKSDMEQIKQQLSKLLSPQVDKASASLKP